MDVPLPKVLSLLGGILSAGCESEGLTADAPLMESGLESLRAVDLRDQLQDAARIPLPASLVFDHPTARAIAPPAAVAADAAA